MQQLASTALVLLSLVVLAPAQSEQDLKIHPAGQLAGSGDSVLLICDASLEEAWKPFAHWKTRQGKMTKILTVQTIAAEYEGPSIQEKIRTCVRQHIDERGTRWVLLGGDCSPEGGGVPGGHRTVHAQERRGIPTDIVYISPTNWDADGDGIYGEWRDDQEAISYPDGSVGLGRAPVRTAADVAAFTEKVVEYESAYPSGAFAQKMMYTNTERQANAKVKASWDRHVSKNWKGEALRFFADGSPWDDEGKAGSHDLNAENLIDVLNQGQISKLHIHGHGLLDRWVLEGRSMFKTEQVSQLENHRAYPLITTVSCNTGEYDSKRDPSVVEAMIRQPKAGAVAVVAPVRTGKMHLHKRSDFRLMMRDGKLDGTTMTMTQYWLAGLSEGRSTGEALMTAKSKLVDDAKKSAGYHLCICEINLLGDPTLDFRAQAPSTPKVEVPESLPSGVGVSFVVATDAPGATVCFWMKGEAYFLKKADAKGRATITLRASAAGEVLVTVSGRNLNSVARSIRIE